jgi:hypothetical protein
MPASTYTRFDPRPFLPAEGKSAAKPAKVAKPPRGRFEQSATLATLATLAVREPDAEENPAAFNTWAEGEDERAAIIEYDGAVPRTWAEALARLDPARPPGDVPAKRWVQFIDDCGRFLDSGWASRVETLGWGPLDLFGCDRERPFARVDHLGLLWLVKGGAIIDLRRDRAILQTKSGAHQTYRRGPVEVGRVVLAWELYAQTART